MILCSQPHVGVIPVFPKCVVMLLVAAFWEETGEGSSQGPREKTPVQIQHFRSQDEPLPDISGRIPAINGLVNRGFPPPFIAGKGPFCRYFSHGVLTSTHIP